MLERTRIVMVNTSHPGNIGAAARAMKTMGMSELCLVAPLQFPHQKALEMASGATDLLENVRVVNTLEEAVADCSLVIGTSARMRAIPWPLVTPHEMAAKVRAEAPNSETAIVFGREQSGLTNDELQRCNLHVHIPANPDYSSLNIAAAVQIITYELRMASLQPAKPDGASDSLVAWDYRFATANELELYFNHLEEVLIQIAFLNPSAPRKLMTRLRRLYLRARPDIMEMNILRGMLSAVQESLDASLKSR